MNNTKEIAANALLVQIQENGLEPETGKNIQDRFMPFFEQAQEWKIKAEALVITDVNQTREMKMAREARLALKDIRVNADKTRKALKEDSLRYGKAVQGVYNVIEYLIAPIEKHLEEQEKFAQIQEAKRKETLKSERIEALAPYEIDVAFYDLGAMPEETFTQLLTTSKLAFEQKIEAQRKAEEERIAKEKAEAEERERIRLENIRLKEEAEERERVLVAERKAAEAEAKRLREEQDKALAAERDKAETERKAAEAEARRIQAEQDAKLKAEREERERIEAALKEQQDKEVAAKKAAEEEVARKLKEEKKAKAAPDKNKLNILASQIEKMEFPEVTSEEAKVILNNARGLLIKTASYIKEKTTEI